MFVSVSDRPLVAELMEAQDRAVMETKSATIHRKMPLPARQLPITGSAHKAGNGRRPLPARTGTVRSARDLPPRVLSVRAGPVAAVPTALSGRPDGAASIRRSGLLRGTGRACTGRHLRRLARAATQIRMGRLRQATVRRSRGRAGLSQPLHP